MLRLLLHVLRPLSARRRAKGSEYCVRYIELPLTVNGMTVMDADGFYNLYVNSARSPEKQQETLRHKLRRTPRGDFFGTAAPEEIKSAAGAAPASGMAPKGPEEIK